MNLFNFKTQLLVAALFSPMMLLAGCAHDGDRVSHTESDKKGWFGGEVHEANSVYKNSDGSTSVESENTTTKDGTTVIVRERKTTNTDGSMKTDRETRTIVRGTDNTVTESTKTTN